MKITIAAIPFLMVFPVLVHACEKPGKKPAFPDINTAVAAQMIKAHADDFNKLISEFKNKNKK